MTDAPTTLDAILGGRIALEQPRHGYRTAIDPILLAASVSADFGPLSLDAGAGPGAIALCLAHRLDTVRLVALEREDRAYELLNANIARNRFGARIYPMRGDLITMPSGEIFDSVVSNPPYLELAHMTASEHAGKRAAHGLDQGDISLWIKACYRHLRPRGALYLSLRADGLARALPALTKSGGAIRILPLWPKPGIAAKRVLVRAIKASRAPLALLPGLILHQGDGQFTPKAQAILRDGAGLSFENG